MKRIREQKPDYVVCVPHAIYVAAAKGKEPG